MRSFNEWGDFSYGVYIYAFPIQQTLAQFFPAMTLLAMVATSSLLTLAVAALSWHGVEKRALALKGDFAAVDVPGSQSGPRQDRRRRALTLRGFRPAWLWL